MHVYTRAVIAAFRTWGWVPCSAQVPVSVQAWGIATRTDLIVRDTRTNRYILVEIKTSASRLFNARTRQRFHAPLSDVHSTPKNHALAQLALTAMMWAKDTRYSLRFADAYVVVVSSKGVHRYPLEAWCTRFRRRARSILQRTASQRAATTP
jgi:hypothetical protein